MVAKATGKTVVDLLHSAEMLFTRCQEHFVDQTNFTQQQRLQTPRAELASFVRVEVQPRQQRWTRVPQGVFGDCNPHLLVGLHDDFNATDVDVAGEGHVHKFRVFPVHKKRNQNKTGYLKRLYATCPCAACLR